MLGSLSQCQMRSGWSGRVKGRHTASIVALTFTDDQCTIGSGTSMFGSLIRHCWRQSFAGHAGHGFRLPLLAGHGYPTRRPDAMARRWAGVAAFRGRRTSWLWKPSPSDLRHNDPGPLEQPLTETTSPPAQRPQGLRHWSCCSTVDVVMNVNDDTNDKPIAWRSAAPDMAIRQIANPLTARATPDDDDISAQMPPPQQTIWPRVWPGL
jgi:hypothetical protein